MKELLDLFKDHNLKLVLQGHLHIVEEAYIGGIRFITGGAVSAMWWNGPRGDMEEGYVLLKIKGEEIDWEKLEELCARMRIRSPLYHSLRLCRELFGIPISERVLRNLSPPWWRKRIGHFVIRRNLLFPEQSRVSRFSQFLIKVLSIDSWAEAMLWFLFPTREWMKKQYSLRGTREIYPYYLLHPILYVIKSLRTPIK